MSKIIRLILFLLLVLPSWTLANSGGLPGGRGIMGLYAATSKYQRANPNTVPTFDELAKLIDPAWIERQQSEFIWMHTPIAFHDGTIHAITAYPILEDRKEDIGRYALYFNKKNAVDAIWADEGELQRAFAAAAQAPLAGKLYVQPVTMWDKLPDYLKRMSEDDRAAFIKEMKDRYQLSITDDGKIASPADSVATAPTPTLPPVKTQAAPQAKPTEITALAPTSVPTSTTQIYWIAGAAVLLLAFATIMRRKRPRT